MTACVGWLAWASFRAGWQGGPGPSGFAPTVRILGLIAGPHQRIPG